ncbi:hypothetical protein A2326_04445 [candidate division WWE3 bacterium RIFOXYB2_FULL_41_6]|nr:MAG: hypothetical protein A2326_04445 [candidate division WWE3 bacterium RIFOXYB2_FULL_41_6]HLD51400.1 hypothetical protein [Patescibacteria group bacterium]
MDRRRLRDITGQFTGLGLVFWACMMVGLITLLIAMVIGVKSEVWQAVAFFVGFCGLVPGIVLGVIISYKIHDRNH